MTIHTKLIKDRLISSFFAITFSGASLFTIALYTMLSLAQSRSSITAAFAFVRNHLAMSSSGYSSLTEMPQLPSDVVKYSQVPKAPKTFTVTTIPKGILKEHTTKSGTWGIINVMKGSLEYQINEPTIRKFELTAPSRGVIIPMVHHQVKPLTDDVEFIVEFYRVPGTGPVDEKREGLTVQK